MRKWQAVSAIFRRSKPSSNNVDRVCQCASASLRRFSMTPKNSEGQPQIVSDRSRRRAAGTRDVQRALQSSTSSSQNASGSTQPPGFQIRYGDGDSFHGATPATFRNSSDRAAREGFKIRYGSKEGGFDDAPPPKVFHSSDGEPREGSRLRYRSTDNGSDDVTLSKSLGRSGGRARGSREPRERSNGRRFEKLEGSRGSWKDNDKDGKTLEMSGIRHLEEKEVFPVPYEPVGYTPEKLKDEWPGIILGPQAMIENVEGKLSFLAGRLPGDYVVPQELAKRVQKGELVEFKDEEEKAEVVRLAEERAKASAEKLSKRQGVVVEAVGMEVQGFEDRERKEVTDKLVRGLYKRGDEGKDRGLVAEVMRNLVNNGTYKGADSEMFMKKLQGLIAVPKKRAATQKDRR